jgi:hypothetical protein
MPAGPSGYWPLAGGLLGLLLAPVMVTIKYMTGWAVVPEPAWVPAGRHVLATLLPSATPPGLWMAFGTAYSFSLLLMLAGVLGMRRRMVGTESRALALGYWLLVPGLAAVLCGDAIHTWTWHQNGLTVPTPGTNPVANTAYAVHMMGMNFVMVGSLLIGGAALRGKHLERWLAWSFLLVFPSAVFASLTLLPTTPGGALWFFSSMMLAYGCNVASGRQPRRAALTG